MSDVAEMFYYRTDSQIMLTLSHSIHHRPIEQLGNAELDRLYLVLGLARNIYKRYSNRSSTYTST